MLVSIFYLYFSWTNVILGVLGMILFSPGIFVEHNMAEKEWKDLSKEHDNDLPTPKWTTMLALLMSFYLHKVNATMNEA